MKRLVSIFNDPLIHFLAAALALFVVYGWISPPPEDDPSNRIVITRDGLLTFMQYRMKAFDPERATRRLAAMSDAERERLIADYVQEEALYREAVALGLDKQDYVIKQRMIQKVNFITQDMADSVMAEPADAIAQYFQENQERYRQPASITFTHVFFNAADRAPDAAHDRAEQAMKRLNAVQVPFHQATRHGERFPYGVNFVDKSRDHVESLFGAQMTQNLFAAPPNEAAWQGPFQSKLGAHVVMITRRTDAQLPELEKIRDRVAADWRADRLAELTAKATAAIVQRYDIEIAPELTAARDGG